MNVDLTFRNARPLTHARRAEADGDGDGGAECRTACRRAGQIYENDATDSTVNMATQV